MFFTDDPLDGYEVETAEQKNAIELLPRCSECDQPIQDEFCFVINGEVICESCVDQYKQPTAYLMG